MVIAICQIRTCDSARHYPLTHALHAASLHPIPPCCTAHNVLQVHHDLGQELLYVRCKGVPRGPHRGAPGRAHGVAVHLTVVPQALVKGKALQLLGIELAGLVLENERGALVIAQTVALICPEKASQQRHRPHMYAHRPHTGAMYIHT